MPLAVTARPRTTWPRKKGKKKPDEDVERAVKPALMRMKKETERRARAPSSLLCSKTIPVGTVLEAARALSALFQHRQVLWRNCCRSGEMRGAGRRGAREGAGGTSAGEGGGSETELLLALHQDRVGWGWRREREIARGRGAARRQSWRLAVQQGLD